MKNRPSYLLWAGSYWFRRKVSRRDIPFIGGPVIHERCNLHCAQLRMPMTERMENWHWLYWRLYDTVVPNAGLRQRFARDDARLRSFLRLLRLAGMTRERDGELRLTLRGAFWVHWLQNQFILPYIDRVWSAATGEPFPEEVRL